MEQDIHVHSLEIIHRGRTKLRNPRQRIIGDGQIFRRMETLRSRISIHDDNPIRPRQPQLFHEETETQPTTSQMGPIPIRLRLRTETYAWIQDDSIRRTLKKIRSLPDEDHDNEDQTLVTKQSLCEPNRHRITTTDRPQWQTRL